MRLPLEDIQHLVKLEEKLQRALTEFFEYVTCTKERMEKIKEYEEKYQKGEDKMEKNAGVKLFAGVQKPTEDEQEKINNFVTAYKELPTYLYVNLGIDQKTTSPTGEEVENDNQLKINIKKFILKQWLDQLED